MSNHELQRMEPTEPTIIDHQALLSRLHTYVAGCDGKKEAAAALGIGASYLSDILRGNRPITARISKRFGYVPEIFFGSVYFKGCFSSAFTFKIHIRTRFFGYF